MIIIAETWNELIKLLYSLICLCRHMNNILQLPICNVIFSTCLFAISDICSVLLPCTYSLHLCHSHNLSCSRSPTHTHAHPIISLCKVHWYFCAVVYVLNACVDSLSSQQTSCMTYGCMYVCMQLVCGWTFHNVHCTYICTYLLMYLVHMYVCTYRRVCFVYTPASAYECESIGTIKGESERGSGRSGSSTRQMLSGAGCAHQVESRERAKWSDCTQNSSMKLKPLSAHSLPPPPNNTHTHSHVCIKIQAQQGHKDRVASRVAFGD